MLGITNMPYRQAGIFLICTILTFGPFSHAQSSKNNGKISTSTAGLARPTDWGSAEYRLFRKGSRQVTFALVTSWIPGENHKGMLRYKLRAFPTPSTESSADASWRTFDAASPCASLPDTTCELVGTETVDGRLCVKWQLADKNMEPDRTVWFDKKTGVPVKFQRNDDEKNSPESVENLMNRVYGCSISLDLYDKGGFILRRHGVPFRFDVDGQAHVVALSANDSFQMDAEDYRLWISEKAGGSWSVEWACGPIDPREK